MMEVDNGTSDVGAAEVDGTIDVDKGPVFKLDTVAPESNGAIWVSNDGPGGIRRVRFRLLIKPVESFDMFDK